MNKLCAAEFVCVCWLLPRGEFVIILIVALRIFSVRQGEQAIGSAPHDFLSPSDTTINDS